MNRSQHLTDPLLIATWQDGKPLSAGALGARTPEELGRLKRLVETGLVEKTLLSSVRCEKDGERLKPVDRSRALVCPRCSTTIELDKPESLGFYTFQVGFPELAKQTKAAFKAHGLPIGQEGAFPSGREILSIGTASGEGGTSIEILLARKRVGPSALLATWGYCATSSRISVLIHPGLSEQAESYLRLSFQACPIYALHASGLGDDTLFEAARKFPKFRRTVESRLKGVESVLFPDGRKPSVEEVDPFGVDADELAKHGKASYEPTALSLLSILGPTLPFSRRGGVRQVPDGILLLPDGVWIVDAKSASDHFRYQQSQRDQVWRYLETIERRRDHFDAHWRFYGEVIVTLTDPLDPVEIERARRDLRARGTSAVVSIVSHEGLRRLWERARSMSEYWHRRILSEDPRDLLLLHNRFASDSRVGEEVRIGAETPLRLVSGPLLDAYWDAVLKNPYHGVSMRNPVDVLTRLEEMFIRDFGA